MTGFILAAGFGTRLRPLTEIIPKALIPVAGIPLLGHVLHFFHSNGIDKIGVNTHYLPEMIEEYRNKSTIPFTLFHEEGEIRGTGGAFNFAREFLSNEDVFFVANVDILAQYSLISALKYFRKTDAICLLLAFHPEGKGTILYDMESSLYCGTPQSPLSDSNINSADFIGAAFYKREYLDYIDTEDFSIVPTWSRAVKDGKKVLVYIVNQGFWRDIGTPKTLLDIHCDIIDKKIDLIIPECYTIDSKKKVCVSKSVKISDNFESYSWIESEHVTENIKVSRSLIFPDANIADIKTIENSIVTAQGVMPAL